EGDVYQVHSIAKERTAGVDKVRGSINADRAVHDRPDLRGAVVRDEHHVMTAAAAANRLKSVDANPRAGVTGVRNKQCRAAADARVSHDARVLARPGQDG